MSEPRSGDPRVKQGTENLTPQPQKLVEIPFDAERIKLPAELEQWAESMLASTFRDRGKKWEKEELEHERKKIEETLQFYLTARGITQLPCEVHAQRQVIVASGFPRLFNKPSTLEITISQQGKATVQIIQ